MPGVLVLVMARSAPKTRLAVGQWAASLLLEEGALDNNVAAPVVRSIW